MSNYNDLTKIKDNLSKMASQVEDALSHTRIVNIYYEIEGTHVIIDLELRFLDGPFVGEYIQTTIKKDLDEL